MQYCADNSYSCIPTIGDTFTRLNGAENTRVALGVGFQSQDESGMAEALEAARASDVVVLVLGTSNDVEKETLDRTDTRLPGLQEALAHQVLALGKPVVLVLINGGIVSIDSLVQPCGAIVEAFNPSRRGAEALFLALFGHANRWGRLPVTVYPAAYTSQVDMYDFDMAKPPGRTYRYYTGEPLFQFGHGLSYSPFALRCEAKGPTSALAPRRASVHIACSVTNFGGMDGDEVLMVFHSAGDAIRSRVSHAVPKRSLVAFERVGVKAGKAATVDFHLDADAFRMTDTNGNQVVYAGAHHFQVFDGVTWLKSVATVQVASEHFKTTVERVPKP